MAYAQHTDPRNRATALAGVIGIHAGLAALLVIGLAASGQLDKPERLTAIPLPDETPPTAPVPPEPSSERLPTPRAPLPPLPLPPTPGPSVALYDPAADLPLDPTPPPTPQPTFSPTPTPSFTPRAAVPRGSAAGWITTDDYPGRALRNEEQGVARYRLIVSSSGKPTACEITASSGSGELDRETCRLLLRRAQFEPAIDASGARVVGTFGGSVRWQIPD